MSTMPAAERQWLGGRKRGYGVSLSEWSAREHRRREYRRSEYTLSESTFSEYSSSEYTSGEQHGLFRSVCTLSKTNLTIPQSRDAQNLPRDFKIKVTSEVTGADEYRRTSEYISLSDLISRAQHVHTRVQPATLRAFSRFQGYSSKIYRALCGHMRPHAAVLGTCTQSTRLEWLAPGEEDQPPAKASSGACIWIHTAASIYTKVNKEVQPSPNWPTRF
ncbi:LADA_0H01112g1_1 [Lachancea dasiensis]|uniref:LADA_0H01112g1_1 n=1 Tax=Lachancea dasiensis TaxID=1072105 RepID=A0A1G4JZ51_9SACH|nr:LADA_0H01112g1_1 [Lachancea dasiensis]